jgi:hypothetical protein
MFKYLFSLLFLSIFLLQTTFSQTIEEKVYKEGIRTVQVQLKGDSLALPIMQLNTGQKIKLSFDDLNSDYASYSYKIIHCDASWNPSGLYESEYLKNQFSASLDQAKNSFNTLTPYKHYSLAIPNENIQPKISGNYAILVYENYNEQDTVLTAHFRIAEGNMSVSASMERINRMSPDKPNQKLNIKLHTGSMRINNPYNNLKIIIQQNGHKERLIKNVNPTGMSGNNIMYSNLPKLNFKGGNEFHHFNTKSKKFSGKNIEKINFFRNHLHFKLKKDKIRQFTGYKLKKDLNGQFLVDKEMSTSPETESDYVYVYFSLKDPSPNMSGKIYVIGDFNNWKCLPENAMEYNYKEKSYENRLLLKQGYYDYKYVLKDKTGLKPCFVSGNYFQTENNYTILVYYRSYNDDYDRLTGYTIFNSMKDQYED